jgi:hypothetical protein
VTCIIVLVNLKPGKNSADYEQWARETDLPTVNALPSVDRFDLFRATGLLTGGKSPYDYVEIIDLSDMDKFVTDTSNDTMAAIAAEFQEWADPIFIVTEKV